jgi:endonuclease YncB( thermonuclease family)
MGCRASSIERPHFIWKGKVIKTHKDKIYNLSTKRCIKNVSVSTFLFKDYEFIGTYQEKEDFIRENRVVFERYKNQRAVELSFCGVSGEGYIDRVIDGDTFILLYTTQNKTFKARIRLYGVDAFEKFTEKGQEAFEFIHNLIEKKRVVYHLYNYDKYGRILADIIYDNQNISDVLIRKGFGKKY